MAQWNEHVHILLGHVVAEASVNYDISYDYFHSREFLRLYSFTFYLLENLTIHYSMIK